MAKLSELLGGILKDVIQARATADGLTREYFDAYRQHPLMAQLPVPRVTIKEVQLKLRFAVESHTEPTYTEDQLDEAIQTWVEHLKTKVLPPTYQIGFGLGRLDPRARKVLSDAADMVRVPSFALADALKGNTRTLLAASLNYVVAVKKQLPADVRKRVPSITNLRKSTKGLIAKEVSVILPRLRQLVAAKRAVGMDLDVLISRSDLEAVRPTDVQEITLTLGMDDVQVFAPEPATTGDSEP